MADTILSVFLPKKKQKTGVAIDANLASKIPYVKCYEEEGIIETTPGNYTKSYIVGDIDVDEISKTSPASARQVMQVIMNSFPENVSYEFTTHNRLIEQEKYLKQVLVVPNKEPELNKYISEYNNVIADNVSIGHNNIRKTNYFTVSVKCGTVDDAVQTFKEIDAALKNRFSQYYGVEIKGLSLIARLRVLYSMYNPGKGDFGKLIDLDGDGNLDLNNMRYMHINTKDLVAPVSINHSYALKNHMIFDQKTEEPIYTRSFAITNIPRVVSDNVISDLTNTSSSMIFSSIYEPIDTSLGYETVKEDVINNTVTKDVFKRDSVADRKAHTKVQQKEQVSHTEKDYFNNAALDLFQKNVAATQKTFSVIYVVTIFGASIEDIDRDSSLLKISADKFGFKLKSLDLQQLQGFQTSLPLCTPRIDLRRIVDIDRLVTMCPISIQDIIRQGGMFNGLNAINDNLILLNRKNNKNLCGVISGVGHSGKTYQCKKEIFNALISSTDDVSVIVNNDEYDEFASLLGGEVVDRAAMDIMQAVKGYGFQDREGNDEKDIMLKSYFLDAFFMSLYKTGQHLFHDQDENYTAEETVQQLVEAEVAECIKYLDDQKVDLTSKTENHYAMLCEYIKANKDKYPTLNELLLHNESSYVSVDAGTFRPQKRLTVYKVQNKTDMLAVLDYLRNKTVIDVVGEKTGDSKFNWIFIDAVDELLKNSASADYLSEYMYKANLMQTVVTLVLQDAISLINAPVSLIAFEDVVRNSGYFKLLNQGPVERHKFIDLLAIPQALVSYISNVEPGKGIIITASSNVAFDDSFLEKDNKYHQLFAKEIEQIVIDEKIS